MTGATWIRTGLALWKLANIYLAKMEMYLKILDNWHGWYRKSHFECVQNATMKLFTNLCDTFYITYYHRPEVNILNSSCVETTSRLNIHLWFFFIFVGFLPDWNIQIMYTSGPISENQWIPSTFGCGNTLENLYVGNILGPECPLIKWCFPIKHPLGAVALF